MNLAYRRNNTILTIELFLEYYPFGMTMPGRNFSSNEFRYGFNGMEKDDEISGTGNNYTAEFWQYDSRLGRRWNQDPKPNPSISNYATFANNPILFADPLGDTIRFAGADEETAFNEYRDKVFGSDKFSDIQEEIFALESSETDFRLRTGDNVTSEKGGGNTKYNSATGEIDINFGSDGEFSGIQVLSHELKHGHQFLEGKIGFLSNGKPDGILNDYQDEYEAYQRQNRFAGPVGKGHMSNDQIHRTIQTQYPYSFRSTNKSLKTILSGELNEMIRVNKLHIQHGKPPRFIYNGYKSDL
jgi:RHS repeat-associated protein